VTFILFFLFQCLGFAADIQLPLAMNQTERESTLRLLGPTTSGKVLGDPYPLGGYSGFEFGVQHEVIPAAEVSRFGQRARDSEPNLTYQKLTLGKGLFNDVDLFFAFTPWSRVAGITEFGGMMRWQFLRFETAPAGLSLMVHGNVTNLRNLLITENGGMNLLGFYNWRGISIYSGIGQTYSSGRFDSSVAASNRNENEQVHQFSSMAGLAYRWHELQVALEANRYAQTVYSGKVSLRF
jgi:hypothetical protein